MIEFNKKKNYMLILICKYVCVCDPTLIKRNILPIRKTRTTRKSVGDIGKSIITSSMSIPNIDANTNTKSKTFHGTVK